MAEQRCLAGLAVIAEGHPVSSVEHQMPAEVEAAVLELRRQHRARGSRRIVVEPARRGVTPMPSESGVYRAPTRAGSGRIHHPGSLWRSPPQGSRVVGIADGPWREALQVGGASGVQQVLEDGEGRTQFQVAGGAVAEDHAG